MNDSTSEPAGSIESKRPDFPIVESRIGSTMRSVGYSTLLWNWIEDYWYLIFDCVLKEVPRPIIDSIYFSAGDGNKRRALVSRVASQTWAEDSRELKTLAELGRRMNELAMTRNHLVHANYGLTVDEGVADVYIAPGYKRSFLAERPVAEILVELIANLRSLYHDTDALLESLSGPRPEGIVILFDIIDLIFSSEATHAASLKRRPTDP